MLSNPLLNYHQCEAALSCAFLILICVVANKFICIYNSLTSEYWITVYCTLT